MKSSILNILTMKKNYKVKIYKLQISFILEYTHS